MMTQSRSSKTRLGDFAAPGSWRLSFRSILVFSPPGAVRAGRSFTGIEKEGKEEDERADLWPAGGRKSVVAEAGWRCGLRHLEYISDDILNTRYILDGLSRHPLMVVLADYMLASSRRLAETKAGHEKTLLSRSIEATDKQIDRLVCGLRGLSEDEIAIVEEAAGG